MTLERRALKRTRLQRRTPMRRTAMRRESVDAKSVRRRRDTGPSVRTKELLWLRAGGRCELCNAVIDGAFSRHHRRPRGMGGSRAPWINDVTNLLLVCGTATTPDGCHQRIESQRTMAYGYGWLVRDGQVPSQEPAMVRGRLVWLTRDGQYADRPDEVA